MRLLKHMSHIGYHIAIVLASAAVAFSLPAALRLAAERFVRYRVVIESSEVALVLLEIGVAVALIIVFNYVGRSWKDRRLSVMARSAGLFFMSSARGLFGRRRVKRLIAQQSAGRDIMVIGSTGYRTFVDPEGDLHQAVRHCRGAKILLLDPTGEGATARSKSIGDPLITVERFSEQILQSIAFLKGLKAAQRNIRIKLYRDLPLLKLAILGDYAFLRHYPTGLDVRRLPEYVFRHTQTPGGLYSPLYHYFLQRWLDPGIPEYELETDELVYRDKSGNEVRREPFALADLAESYA